mgnify:CR=1 FL=1
MSEGGVSEQDPSEINENLGLKESNQNSNVAGNIINR